MFSNFFKKSNKMNEVVNNSAKIEAPKIEQPVKDPIDEFNEEMAQPKDEFVFSLNDPNNNVLHMSNKQFGMFMDQVDVENPVVYCKPTSDDENFTTPEYDGRNYWLIKITQSEDNFGRLIEKETIVGRYDTKNGVLIFTNKMEDVQNIVIFVYGTILMFS